MAYLRTSQNDSALGAIGCGPGCNCGPCRAGKYRLGERYVPEDDDDAMPPPSTELSGWGAAPSSSPRILFLPGIMGSRLVDRRDSRVLWGDQSMAAWLPSSREWIARMRQGNGIDSPGNVEPQGLFHMKSLSSNQDLNPYTAALAFWRQHLGSSNVLTCPYDWRLSNESSAMRLKRVVETAWQDAARDPNRRGTLVAHSMGGIVARWYIEKLGGHQFVRRLVTVGTPHHGAPKAIQVVSEVGAAPALLGFIAPALFASPMSLFLGPLLSALRGMVDGFASIYQLMPDFNCLYPSFIARTMEPISATYDRLRNSPALNPILGPPRAGMSLIRGPRSHELRRLNDALLAGESSLASWLAARHIQYICIAGFANSTTIALRHTTPITISSLVSKCGDGTVPVRSAALHPSGSVRVLYTATAHEHGTLFWDPNIQRACLNAAQGSADITSGLPSAFLPSHPACAPPHLHVPIVSDLPSAAPILPSVQKGARRASQVPAEILRESERAARALRSRLENR